MSNASNQSTGRVAVITGASSGIGEATARVLAANGFRVALLARRADRIHALASELGHGAIAIRADVTDRDSLIAAAGRVQAELGEPMSWSQRRHHAARPSPPRHTTTTGA